MYKGMRCQKQVQPARTSLMNKSPHLYANKHGCSFVHVCAYMNNYTHQHIRIRYIVVYTYAHCS